MVSVDRNATARGLALVRLGRNGDFVFDNRAGTIGLNVSVVGYVSSDTGGGSLVPLRRTTLSGAAPLTVTPQPTSVPIAGRAGVPGRRASRRAERPALERLVGVDGVGVAFWFGTADPQQLASRDGGPAAGRIIVPSERDGSISVAADQQGEVAFDVVGYVAQNS